MGLTKHRWEQNIIKLCQGEAQRNFAAVKRRKRIVHDFDFQWRMDKVIEVYSI